MPQRRSPSLPCLTSIDLSYRPRQYSKLEVATQLVATSVATETKATEREVGTQGREKGTPSVDASPGGPVIRR